MEKFDLIVVGSGSGNIVIEQALKSGLKCALIEKGKFGGTCLTRGCIPTKVLATAADFIRKAQKSSSIGVEINDIQVNFAKVRERVFEKINESNFVKKYMQNLSLNLTLYEGTAYFTGEKQMKVKLNSGGEVEISADKIVLGIGARSAIPNIPGIEDIDYLISENFFGDKFPDKPYSSLAILGGSYIGMEFAHIFSAFGSEVSIIQRNDYLIPKEEPAISMKAKEIMESYGVNVYTGKDTLRVYEEEGKKVIQIKDKHNGKVQEIRADEIFLATGLVSNADLTNVEKAGVALDSKGYILSNEFLETNVNGIYVIGDVNGKMQFRHKANYEAELLSENLFGKNKGNKEFASYNAVPAVTYMYPQVAHVGLTEKEALEQGFKIKVAKHHYSDTAKGFALGYEKNSIDDGFAKIIADENDKILGVHVMGDEAALLVQPYVELMVAALKDITPDNLELTNTAMPAHPSLAEVSLWTKYMDFKEKN